MARRTRLVARTTPRASRPDLALSTQRSRSAPSGHAALLLAAGIAATSLTTVLVVSLTSTRPDPVEPVAPAPLALASASPGDPEPLVVKDGGDAEIDLVQQRAVLAALGQAGITAESLAAAGVLPQQATAIGSAVAEDIETLGAVLDAATSSVLSGEQQADSLERLLIAGVATQEQVNQLATARNQLVAARAAREVAVAEVWEVATDELGGEVVARLEHLRTTSSRPLLPSLRALTYEPQGWGALENAYTSVRVAEALEMDPDPAAEAIVTTASAQPAATTAAGWLASNLATIELNLAAAAGQ